MDKIFVKLNGVFVAGKIVGDDVICKMPSYKFKYAVFTEDYDQPKHKLFVDEDEYIDVSKVWHTYVYDRTLYLVLHQNHTFELVEEV